MLKGKYKSHILNSSFKSHVWAFIALFLLVSNFLLSIKIFNLEIKEKTIIHPVSMTEKYTIEGDNIDPLLIQELAEEFLKARLLYTPKTVAKQFDNITKHFHPEIYGDKKSELDADAQRIIRNNETSVFFPMNYHVRQKTAYIEGEITGYLGKKSVTQEVKTYQVDFRSSGGRIWIYDWFEVIHEPIGDTYTRIDDQSSNN